MGRSDAVVSLRVCECARVRVCVCACVLGCVCLCVCMSRRLCTRALQRPLLHRVSMRIRQFVRTCAAGSVRCIRKVRVLRAPHVSTQGTCRQRVRSVVLGVQSDEESSGEPLPRPPPRPTTRACPRDPLPTLRSPFALRSTPPPGLPSHGLVRTRSALLEYPECDGLERHV